MANAYRSILSSNVLPPNIIFLRIKVGIIYQGYGNIECTPTLNHNYYNYQQYFVIQNAEEE